MDWSDLVEEYSPAPWALLGFRDQDLGSRVYGSFLKLGVPFLGVPIRRIIVYWGLYWGPLILGNYHIVPFMIYVLSSNPVCRRPQVFILPEGARGLCNAPGG